MTPIRPPEPITKNNAQLYRFEQIDPSKEDFLFQMGFVRVCPSRNLVQQLIRPQKLVDFIYGFHNNENDVSPRYVSTYEDDQTESRLSIANQIARDQHYGKFLLSQQYDTATGKIKDRLADGLTEQDVSDLDKIGQTQLKWIYSLQKTAINWFNDNQTAKYEEIWITQDAPLIVRLKFSHRDMLRDSRIEGLRPGLKSMGWDFAEEAKTSGKEELWTLRRI